MKEKEYELRKFFFGSIKKKLNIAFGVLVLLIAILVLITYALNRQISEDASFIREVNSPLNVMVEQVIGHDAMLTGAAHASLLHAQKGQMAKVKQHKAVYDEIGANLDDLLKYHAKSLLNKSRRSAEEKRKVYGYLEQLDEINLKLVGLELGAFSAIETGDLKTAYSLIVSDQYDEYKKELADLYKKWLAEETRMTEYYRQRILDNTRKVQVYNLWMGILFVLISLIIPGIINSSISKPISKITLATREIEKGNFKARVDVKNKDEIQELAKSFNKSAEQLERIDEEKKQIDKAKTEFLSITSHELRSPMTPMRAQLQMLLENYFGKLSAKQKESLGVVLRNTERLDRIIQDFLEISRIEAARLKFNFIKTSLTGPIMNVIEEMKGFMPEKQIKFIAKIKKLPEIEADPDRVMQVLRNLLNNAIKFSSNKSRIWINANVQGGSIVLAVKDEGAGIRKQDQPRIFEPFFQAGGMYERKVGGTGLGLAICKGIVESQNGKIWFESEEGMGTMFKFTVPFTPVKEMKPIRVLFSRNSGFENDIKMLMIDLLGPLGEKEFENLKTKGITENNMINYINELAEKGIAAKERSALFKHQVRQVIGKESSEMKAVDGERDIKIERKDIEKFIKRGEKNDI
jgi:signal transduction histidine kinase